MIVNSYLKVTFIRFVGIDIITWLLYGMKSSRKIRNNVLIPTPIVSPSYDRTLNTFLDIKTLRRSFSLQSLRELYNGLKTVVTLRKVDEIPVNRGTVFTWLRHTSALKLTENWDSRLVLHFTVKEIKMRSLRILNGQ